MSGKIEDVVKRLRERAEARRRSGKLLQIDDRMFDLIADEIEEATCDKSSQVGNAAAMYEALKAVVKVGYPHNFQHEAPHISGYCYEITTAIDKCFAALAASPRNCDVMSLKSARTVWFMKEIMPRLDGKLPLGKEKPFDEWFVSQLEQ